MITFAYNELKEAGIIKGLNLSTFKSIDDLPICIWLDSIDRAEIINNDLLLYFKSETDYWSRCDITKLIAMLLNCEMQDYIL